MWPFMERGRATVIEIYPRALTGAVNKSSAEERRAYLARWPELARSVLEAAANSEDAFDAAVSALVMWAHRDELATLRGPEDDLDRLEGAIWTPLCAGREGACAAPGCARARSDSRAPARPLPFDDERPGPRHLAPSGSPPADRALGCLLGGALGDALGYPVEFLSAGDIERRFGREAPARLAYAGAPPALVSDDTQMTLFVAEGIIRAFQRWAQRGICHPASVGLGALMRWYATQTGAGLEGDEVGWLARDRRLHARRAPGATIMSALGGYARDGRPEKLVAANDSKGCGTVMRAAPFGFLATRERAFEAAMDDARLTHGHPTAALAAGTLAALVWDLCRGDTMARALEAAEEVLGRQEGAEETAAALGRAREVAARRPLALESLGGGWVAEEALAFGVACALAFDPAEPRAIERTLWRAACHGGDGDSTAAIAGNLLGATVGAVGLPRAWLADLELRDTIERIGRDLFAALFEGALFAADDYPPD